jgi:hypothetical protein
MYPVFVRVHQPISLLVTHSWLPLILVALDHKRRLKDELGRTAGYLLTAAPAITPDRSARPHESKADG